MIAQHFEAMRLLGELNDRMKPLPSVDGQMSFILDGQAEENKTSAFTFSQEIIDAVLTRGSGIHEGKMRIYEQFQKVDKAAIVTESQKAVEKREAVEKDKPTKSKNEIITEEAVRKPLQKEENAQSNPTTAKTDKNPPSRQNSEPEDMQTDKGIAVDRQKKPSVKEKLDRYKAQAKQQKEAERKEPETDKAKRPSAPKQTVHQQPKTKSKKPKER